METARNPSKVGIRPPRCCAVLSSRGALSCPGGAAVLSGTPCVLLGDA